jgi:hypothetical protein
MRSNSGCAVVLGVLFLAATLCFAAVLFFSPGPVF